MKPCRIGILFLTSLIYGSLMNGAWAASLVRLNCQQSSGTELIESGYHLAEDAGTFTLSVQYAQGRIPIDPDPMTTVRVGDWQGIKKRSELFSRIPHRFTVSFEKKNCKLSTQKNELLWHCYLKTPGVLGKLNYKTLSFFMFSQRVNSAYGESRLYNLGLEFGLSLKETLEEETLAQLTREMDDAQKKAFEAELELNTTNKSMIIAFQNIEGFKECFIPGHTD